MQKQCLPSSQHLLSFRSQVWAGTHEQKGAPSCHLGWETKTFFCLRPQLYQVPVPVCLWSFPAQGQGWAGTHFEAGVSCTKWEDCGPRLEMWFQVMYLECVHWPEDFSRICPQVCVVSAMILLSRCWNTAPLLCSVLLSSNYWPVGKRRCRNKGYRG